MAVTIFHLPGDIITLIVPRLPNSAILSFRLVSKAALKFIQQGMAAYYPDKTLDGTEVHINFTGRFEKSGIAFFQNRKKMAVLNAHPELLDVIANARFDMEKAGMKGPFSVQDFLDFAETFHVRNGYRPITEAPSGARPFDDDKVRWQPIWLNSLPLALVPFDLCHPKLSAPYRCLKYPHAPYVEVPKKNEMLPRALSVAAERDSLDLVTFVLSHPNATQMNCGTLNYAWCIANRNKTISLALYSHTYDERTSSTLRNMVNSGNHYSPKEYATIFIQFSFKTQARFYMNLCKKLGSPTKNVMRDGMVHFIKNPEKCLKALI